MGAKLISEREFRRMADVMLSASTGDDCTVSLQDAEESTLRFANNQVTQNVTVRTPSVSASVSFGKKAGRASTNRFDEASLRDCVARAERIARLAPEDPEHLPPLGSQTYLDVPSYRGSTAKAAPMDLAKRTGPVITRCDKEGLNAAGITTASVNVSGVAASTGLFGYEQATESQFSLTASTSDSSGWTFHAHRDIDRIDVAGGTGRAVDKALRSKSPRELPAGHYPVILEPAAVAGIVGPMFFALSAKSFYRGNSAFVGKLNEQVIDPRLSIVSDPTHPDLTGSRFGGEGLPSRKQTWLENGVLKQLFYDRFTALEHNVEPTPRPSAPIMTVSGETAGSIEDLIATTKRAILITNFWYIRPVKQSDLTMTGMTRDGTFLVEDGKIVCGVRHFRWHESPLRCFKQIDAATGPLECITMERGKMLLPAVRLPEFHLSSVTEF